MPDFPDLVPAGTPSLLGADLQPLKPENPGIYLRRVHTNEQAQAQLSMITGGARYLTAILYHNCIITLSLYCMCYYCKYSLIGSAFLHSLGSSCLRAASAATAIQNFWDQIES